MKKIIIKSENTINNDESDNNSVKLVHEEISIHDDNEDDNENENDNNSIKLVNEQIIINNDNDNDISTNIINLNKEQENEIKESDGRCEMCDINLKENINENIIDKNNTVNLSESEDNSSDSVLLFINLNKSKSQKKELNNIKIKLSKKIKMRM